MSYEELVESKKNIGDMTRDELYEYCGGLLSEVWDYEKENEQLQNKVEELMELYTTERHCKDDYKSIIKEVREEMENAKHISVDDNKAIIEHEKRILEILDKENI